MYPDILVSPGEDPGRSWGSWGVSRSSCGVLGEACTRLECQKGGLEIEFGIPEKVHEG